MVGSTTDDFLEIRNLLEQHLDWAEILGFLCYYRIAGAAYHTIKKCHPLPQKTNGDFILALMTIYEAQKVRTEKEINVFEEDYLKVV